MASFNLTRVDTFPEGTSVGAYLCSAFKTADLPPAGAPAPSATATASMTSGTAAFTGLADDTPYFFAAQVAGVWRYVTGRTLPLNPALASPTFTGVPAAPTAAADTNTTQLATTAFVLGQAYASNPAINGTAAAGSSPKFARGDHVHPTDTTRAALASPTFTGTPAAPTATNGTNTTQLATTAFVAAQRLDQHAVPTAAVDFNGQAPIKLGTVTFGTSQNTNLYSNGTGILKTDGQMVSGGLMASFAGQTGQVVVGTTTGVGTGAPNVNFNDVNLFRSATTTLKTDGAFSVQGNVGFNNATPIAKPTVTGSKSANAALTSLLTALASYGLVTDSSS